MRPENDSSRRDVLYCSYKHEANMLKTEVARGKSGRVIIMDSTTRVTPEDTGAIVVCASHGGSSSGEFALEVPLAVVFSTLEAKGIAAGTVAHTTAKIGNRRRSAVDRWSSVATSTVRKRRQPVFRPV